jgi:ABC-type polysaccharide/polyol phosphate export permease
LLRELVKTDFKLRYQGSAIGYLWSLFRPLFMFAILYVVFTVVFPLGKDGPADIINDKNGFLIPIHDKENFKQKLGILINNEEILNHYMTNAFVESQTWKKEKIVNKWIEILSH